MKISIITVTLNCVKTIEDTLKSIIHQDYKNLEYIVFDGGSTDGTKEILEKYRDHFHYYVSEKDKGQYFSIQNGFNIASGDIICYLNGDDVLMPRSLHTINEIFTKFSDVNWITGLPGFLDETGNYVASRKNLVSYNRKDIQKGLHRFGLLGTIQQESTFFRRKSLEKVGGLDLSLKYACDFKLWKDLASNDDLFFVDVPLAAFRRRPGQISQVFWEEYKDECRSVCKNNMFTYWLEMILEKSNILRTIFKSICYGFGNVISYSKEKEIWVKLRMLLPKSNMSINELRLEFLKLLKK